MLADKSSRGHVRVIVADDEPVMRMYLEDLLPDWGYTVVASAEDGQELVAQCREHHPDLVVTDIRMPKMDGIEAMEAICREAALPVIFVTGFDERDRLALLNGCTLTVLTKPVGEQALRAALEEILQRFQGSEDPRHSQP